MNGLNACQQKYYDYIEQRYADIDAATRFWAASNYSIPQTFTIGTEK